MATLRLIEIKSLCEACRNPLWLPAEQLAKVVSKSWTVSTREFFDPALPKRELLDRFFTCNRCGSYSSSKGNQPVVYGGRSSILFNYPVTQILVLQPYVSNLKADYGCTFWTS